MPAVKRNQAFLLSSYVAIMTHNRRKDRFIMRNCQITLDYKNIVIITFRVRRSRGEILYSGLGCLCVCLFLSAFPHYRTDPDVTWRNGRGCPVVVHYWADLQSVHGFCCYDNTARTRNVSVCLYSLYAWFDTVTHCLHCLYMYLLYLFLSTLSAIIVLVNEDLKISFTVG